MTNQGASYLSTTSLGFGAYYLNAVNTYGTAAVTTLAILVGMLTAISQARTIYLSFRDKRVNQKEKGGDVRNESSNE